MTVLLPPEGTVGSGEVRGGAPATREFALLDPARMMDRVDAVVLSGGSAFGLAAADGVMRLLHERGIGYAMPAGPVPIVIGLSIFDGALGPAAPGPAEGRAAALAALSDEPLLSGGPLPSGEPLLSGRVGAGTGATSGKHRGSLSPGGFGFASTKIGDTTLAAVAVANPWGDIIGPSGERLHPDASGDAPSGPFNTTLVVVMTDARLSKLDCYLLAQSGHNGLARALDPVHTRFDGDAVVTLATGAAGTFGDADALRAATPHIVASAIRAAV